MTKAQAAMDEVQLAQMAVEEAEERIASLDLERKTILQRQATLGAKDAQEFYTLQRRLDELPGEIHFARMSVVQGKIELLEARTARAKAIIAEVQPRFDEQRRVVNEAQAVLNSIGNEMRDSHLYLRNVAQERGALNIRLGNLQNEWAQRMAVEHAPVMRNLMNRPRVGA